MGEVWWPRRRPASSVRLKGSRGDLCAAYTDRCTAGRDGAPGRGAGRGLNARATVGEVRFARVCVARAE